jgi:hypothetical protein
LQSVAAQDKKGGGLIIGAISDSKGKPVESASVSLIQISDSAKKYNTLTLKTGEFSIKGIDFGYYRLLVSYVGMQNLRIDSIYFRTERSDFNMNDLVLKPKSTELLEDVVIYAEKPLVQSKEGNITFNAGESAVAAGATASELLTQVPLVSKDADGKVTVRGKEPKILIDDKPVELNLQQLQDLLESMPGSSIEKIEVLTNPPPQYANEQGGVINIVTKKGKVGKSGRIAISGGTRGELGLNGSFNYKKNKIALSVNAGIGYNEFEGYGYSKRQNIYTDSTNKLNTTTNYTNKSTRPNLRVNFDYEFNKKSLLNFVATLNQNQFDNYSETNYRTLNRFDSIWKLSNRNITSAGHSLNPGFSSTYTYRGKPGETLRIILGLNNSDNTNDREFYQIYFRPNNSYAGVDSLQSQNTHSLTNAQSLRVNYDKMLADKKTFISVGSYFNRNANHVNVDASFKKKPEGIMMPLDLLSNNFWFYQSVTNMRASVKHNFKENISFTIGTSLERTGIYFDLLKEGKKVKNDYWNWLPFGNVNKNWKEKLSITLAYRRTINRPGLNELNPTIDFSDAYNVRFGNPNLVAATSHNFDLIFGRTKPKYFLNVGMGYNVVQDVISSVRTLLDLGKTQVTFENISGRKEYELSSWNGFSLSKKLKVNASASLTKMKYSAFDRLVKKFRNGTSFTSTLGTNYNPTDVWNFSGNFNLNRFASPQGFAKWSTSLNLGIQKKFFYKKLIVTFNMIDPLQNQERKTFTYAPNFNLENYSLTYTRNYRLTIAYNFNARKASAKFKKK